MLVSSLLASAALLGPVAGLVAKRAYEVPSNYGFPKPDDQQVMTIAEQAGGKLPGGPLPTTLGAGSVTAFQLIAFNELFETAFFASLLRNVTENVPGYETDDNDEIITIVKTVLAQEELHALAAIASLQTANAFAPSPCEYTFPSTNLTEAVAIAETFTAVVLGALQDANVIFSTDGQQGAVRIVSSVIGQEGEQNGLYRVFLKRVPSESPFLTTVPGPFAWSALLQNFVVPGSCPFDLSKVNLPIFPGLLVNGGAIATVQPHDQTLSFRANLQDFKAAEGYIGKTEGLYLTYTTGQQLPITVDLEDVQWDGSVITFSADFPYAENVMGGFSHAALTTCRDFKDADSVVGSTLAAPGIIQVVQPI
ncbi:Fc.00g014800.m01.CDS01 [Cosmosporella sp. VM-42]